VFVANDRERLFAADAALLFPGSCALAAGRLRGQRHAIRQTVCLAILSNLGYLSRLLRYCLKQIRKWCRPFSFPSGAKAHLLYGRCAARLKPCPFKTGLRQMQNALACGEFDTVGVFFDFAAVFAESAVAALAALEVGDSFEQVESAEVGPVALGDEDLGVGDLPQQII